MFRSGLVALWDERRKSSAHTCPSCNPSFLASCTLTKKILFTPVTLNMSVGVISSTRANSSQFSLSMWIGWSSSTVKLDCLCFGNTLYRAVDQQGQVNVLHYFWSSGGLLLNVRPGEGSICPTELLSKMSHNRLRRLICIKEVTMIAYTTTICVRKPQGFLSFCRSLSFVADDEESNERFVVSDPILISNCQI